MKNKFKSNKSAVSIRELFLVLLFLTNTIAAARIFDEFQLRGSYWKQGWYGFITITNFEGKGNPPVTLFSEKWPPSIHLSRYGVPFDLPEEPDEILYTGTESKESITVSISPKTREIFLLISADFPEKIPLLDPTEKLMRRTVLDDPKQVSLEIVYSDGSSDHFIPANVRKPLYGIENGLGLYVVHPDQNKKPINLILHDRMRTAAFGIWAITLNTRKPVVEEPQSQFRWYQQSGRMTSPAPMGVRFNLSNGIAWDNIESKVWGGKIPLSNSPVFSITIKPHNSKKTYSYNSREFSIIDLKQDDNSCQVVVALQKEEISLSGIFSFMKNNSNQILLDLKLFNAGKIPVELNLKFPIIESIKFLDWDDTWYFSPAFGGIINNINSHTVSEFGDEHPLQFDGFFSVKNGGGLMIMTPDTSCLSRIYIIGKTNSGCFYSIEYKNRPLMPGELWIPSPVVITPVTGTWKEQFTKYREWIRNYMPKEIEAPLWFKKSFVMISCNVEEGKNLIETLNTAFDKLSVCDIVQICLGFNKNLEFINSSGQPDQLSYERQNSDIVEKLSEELMRIPSLQGKPTIMPTNYFRKLITLEQELNLITNTVQRLKKSNIPFAVKLSENILTPLKYHSPMNAEYINQQALEYLLFLKECYVNINDNIKPDILCAKCSGYPDTYFEEKYSFKPFVVTNFLNILRSITGSNTKIIAHTLPVDAIAGYFSGGHSCLLPNYNSCYGKIFQSFMNYYKFKERISPHQINLFRFSFPELKIFNVVAPFSKEYRDALKFAFFNGEAICLDESAIELMDEEDVEQLQKIYRIYVKFSEAFLSSDVEPLVSTPVTGIFANRFSCQDYTIWTVYNSNFKQVHGNMISVNHVQGARYFDLLNDREIPFKQTGNKAELYLSIMPRSIACIAQIKKLPPVIQR